jgi:hypothetical protein
MILTSYLYVGVHYKKKREKKKVKNARFSFMKFKKALIFSSFDIKLHVKTKVLRTLN